MNRLADVELQLIMHGLQATEILQLARCSPQLMHAADSSFAWLHTTLQLHFCRWFNFGRRKLPLSRLFSPASPSLLWDSSIPATIQEPRVVGDLLFLARGLWPLRELDASNANGLIRVDSWQRILLAPQMQQQRVLRTSLLPNKAKRLLPLIAALPRLHTLAITHIPGDDSGTWMILSGAPALTCLHLGHILYSTEHARSALLLCHSLTRVHWTNPPFGGILFRQFFAASSMQQQLQHLQLDYFPAAFVPAADYALSFSGLHRLRSLHLRRVAGTDHLLSQLAHAPALRHLTVELRYEEQWKEAVSTIPSIAVLSKLMESAPRMQLRLDWLATVDNLHVNAKEVTARVEELADALVTLSHRFSFVRGR
jgi:hypothetical protein